MPDKYKPFDLLEWAQAAPESFDLTAEFHARIQPLLDALTAECKALDMPALINVTYKQTANDAEHCMLAILPGAARSPANLLFMKHASKADQEGMDAVLAAIAYRMHTASVPANTTKH